MNNNLRENTMKFYIAGLACLLSCSTQPGGSEKAELLPPHAEYIQKDVF